MGQLCKHFASDNYAGVHPEILQAISAANAGHAAAYGADEITLRLQDVIAKHFGAGFRGYPVFNGTAANVLALQTLLPRWGAVIAANTSHINVDEAGAPERVGGIKILTVPNTNGKLTPELIDREAWGLGDVHRAQPLAVSITQATELGTVYSKSELQEIVDFAHSRGMLVHVDGARLSNAAAHLNLPFAEFTTELGVDAISLGATKNGALGAEAVILKEHGSEAPTAIEFLRKMNLQLASKMRFISAQLVAMYEGDLWQRSANHANSMATRLREAIEASASPNVRVSRPTQANAVFVTMPPELAVRAQQRFMFYQWPGSANEYRLMCSFDTTPVEVDQLVAALTES